MAFKQNSDQVCIEISIPYSKRRRTGNLNPYNTWPRSKSAVKTLRNMASLERGSRVVPVFQTPKKTTGGVPGGTLQQQTGSVVKQTPKRPTNAAPSFTGYPFSF